MKINIWTVFPVVLILTLTSWTISKRKNKSTLFTNLVVKDNNSEKTKSIEKDTIEILNFNQFDSLFNSRTNDPKVYPRLYIESTKNSIDKLNSSDRKKAFIQMIAIHALKVNEEIIQERKNISSSISDSNKEVYIDSLLKLYRARDVNELEEKLNTIPVDLIIAQAITESGWGRSYSAKHRNAFFGQITGKKNGKLTYRSFKNIQSAVRGYVLNINRHNAYKTMRAIRSDNKLSNGSELIVGMTSYSELGNRYVEFIQTIIKMYNLESYNKLQLESSRESIVNIQA